MSSSKRIDGDIVGIPWVPGLAIDSVERGSRIDY